MRRPSRRFLRRTGPAWPPAAADNEPTIKAVNALADPYDTWHEAELDKGYAVKATEWRANLPKSDEEEMPPPSGEGAGSGWRLECRMLRETRQRDSYAPTCSSF